MLFVVSNTVQGTSPVAESISVAMEDISSHSPQAVTSPDAQTNISKVIIAMWQSASL